MTLRSLLLLPLLAVALTGCARSHTDDTDGAPIRIDGGPPPTPDECTSAADCTGGATCVAGECVPPDGPAQSRTYAVTALAPRESDGIRGDGYDLDGVVSTGSGSTCVDLTPDLTSRQDGSSGVDNALSSLVPQLGMLLSDSCPAGRPAAECVGFLHEQAIARGEIQLEIDVDGIHSFTDDDAVEVRLISHGMQVAMGAGRIRGGRLEASFPGSVAFPMLLISPEIGVYAFEDARIGGTITPTSLTNGAFAGSVAIEELALRAEAIMPGFGDTVRSVLGGIADMRPRVADPTACERLSGGFAIEATVR